MELNVTSGNVSALAGPGDDAKRLQITAPVQPGNSGGPLARRRRERRRRGGEQARRRPRRQADRRHSAERQLRHQGRAGAWLPRHPRHRLSPAAVERESRPGTTRGACARLHHRRALLGVGVDAF